MKALGKSSTSRIFDITPLTGDFIKNLKVSNNDITDISPVKVRKVKKTYSKEKWVYDFTVNKFHNFVANRVFVHNTTLLDSIRKTNVAGKEVGGITQSIGASVVGKITFIDTPGHAAFSQMRSRGAKVADIALLVVDASGGVKPQTQEALGFIHEAKIPFIVVATKMDLPSASAETVLAQLEKLGVTFEGRGGQVPFIEISAKTGKGLTQLLDLISLVWEVGKESKEEGNDLQAVVIETSKDKAGVLISAIVRNGSLAAGDTVFAEGKEIKIRGLFNDQRKPIKQALAGQPVQILGFAEAPAVGTIISSTSTDKQTEASSIAKPTKLSKEDKVKIKIVIKASNAGSLEAVVAGLPSGVLLVDSGVGDVFESNILDTKALGASYIFAFESKISSSVLKLAEAEGVKIESFAVIYELFQRIEEIVLGGKEEILGKAEITASFPFNDKKIAGCRVLMGKINLKDKLFLKREEKVLGQVRAVSMKKQKQEVAQVGAGEEFGVLLQPQLDFALGDMLVSVHK